MKLTDKIYLIGGGAFGYSAPGDCNIYLVDCGKELAMIDTGWGKGIPVVLKNIKQMGFDSKMLKTVFITHCHYDHIGGNSGIKRETNCKIAAHETEVQHIENLDELSLYETSRQRGVEFESTKVDVILRDGQHVRVGDVDFEVVHTPGHSPGGICLLIKEDGITSTFTGDTAFAQGRLGWINGPGFDLPDWKRSIKRLINIKPDRIFPGHGTFLLSGAIEDLKALDGKMNAPWTNIVTTIG